MTYLKVIQPDGLRTEPRFVLTAAEVTFSDGFYEEERDDTQAFRWMAERGRLTFAPDAEPRFLEFWAFSEFHDLSQSLRAEPAADAYPLVHGWSPVSMDVPAGVDRLDLAVTKVFPPAYYPADHRTLAVRLRAARLHKDAERHAIVRRQFDNAVRNVAETLAARTALDSTPTSLGIDMYGVCNVKPPCVYCEWDFNKELEGEHVTTPFSRDTLREWGPFFDNAVSLVNCSIGEPFMMKNIDDLLDAFGNGGKLLEMTTNGQILTERNIQKLVGRPILLYISLDAATPLTYSRLRNDRFEPILANLRRLIAAKGGRGGFPKVHLVFMPMRCNVHELDDFVRLCADLGVDRLILRPLNYSPAAALNWDRGGYRFEYQKELLPFEELVRVSGRAARLARELGVDLSDQMDFGGTMRELFQEEFDKGASEVATVPGAAVAPAPAASAPLAPAVAEPPAAAAPEPAPLPSLGGERLPACLEPWKSLYILRRGVLPCCYGGRPIAPMEGYRDAWNSPLMQDIRGELLAGRFHDYCLASPACPIVRKSAEAHALPARQEARLRVRAVWARLDKRLGGMPGRVWRPIKRGAQLARTAATDPARAARGVARRVRGR
jgi:MoaA/NifB/PqqE/SkfB family radical SAM enzyme